MAPKGNPPPGHYEVQVRLEGVRPRRPQFRVWRLKEGDLAGQAKGRVRFPDLARALRLEAQVGSGPKGAWILQGPWEGAPVSEDRLLVEVCRGSRRLGWANTGVRELALPSTARPPRPGLEDEPPQRPTQGPS